MKKKMYYFCAFKFLLQYLPILILHFSRDGLMSLLPWLETTGFPAV